MVKFVYSKVTLCTLQVCNFTELDSMIEVPMKIFQTFATVIFRNMFCVEELNYMKDYVKSRREASDNYTENWLYRNYLNF